MLFYVLTTYSFKYITSTMLLMKVTKTNLLLAFFVVLAFVLRIVAAVHTDVSADEMIYSIIPLGIISAGILGTVEQSPLAFYLNDVAYTIFGGITPVTIRLPALFFGAASLVVVFLIGRRIFGRTAGLMGAL